MSDDKYDKLDKLASEATPKIQEITEKRTGQKVDFTGVVEEVKANMRQLDACELPHSFVRMGEKVGTMSRCSLCGGVVSSIHARWYQQGLDDARRLH